MSSARHQDYLPKLELNFRVLFSQACSCLSIAFESTESDRGGSTDFTFRTVLMMVRADMAQLGRI